MCLSWCYDVRAGPGALRAVGLHKAFSVISVSRSRSDGSLDFSDLSLVLSHGYIDAREIISGNGSKAIADAWEQLQAAGALDDGVISFHEFVKQPATQHWLAEEVSFPYRLKDIFSAVRNC